ncbi:MAG: hypothetical protein ACI8RD_007733, partial [Bacillariaceae sp.]|jgi:hypothetical protein
VLKITKINTLSVRGEVLYAVDNEEPGTNVKAEFTSAYKTEIIDPAMFIVIDEDSPIQPPP